MDRNGPETTEVDRIGHFSSSLDWDGGFVGMGGVVREKENHYPRDVLKHVESRRSRAKMQSHQIFLPTDILFTYFAFILRRLAKPIPIRHFFKPILLSMPMWTPLLYMSKDGSIWQLFVLCLLLVGDTVPKCYVLL